MGTPSSAPNNVLRSRTCGYVQHAAPGDRPVDSGRSAPVLGRTARLHRPMRSHIEQYISKPHLRRRSGSAPTETGRLHSSALNKIQRGRTCGYVRNAALGDRPVDSGRSAPVLGRTSRLHGPMRSLIQQYISKPRLRRRSGSAPDVCNNSNVNRSIIKVCCSMLLLSINKYYMWLGVVGL